MNRKIVLTLCIFSCMFSINTSNQFETLGLLQAYAAAYPENIASDSGNNDITHPNFNIFYEHKNQNFFQKIPSYIGITSPYPEWNANLFKELLDTVIKNREKITKTFKESEQTIQIPPGNQCVIWGDLYGAFHSLVRTLAECKKLGFIDSNLNIKNNIHFIFLGNTINNSAYSLETLTTILTLMVKNPTNVIYLQGEHETNGYWEGFTIRSALKMFASNLKTKQDFAIPLSTTLTTFFATLPKILIIHRDPLEKDQAIYLTHRKISAEVLNRLEAEALIFGSEIFETKRSYGLEFKGYSSGTALWSIISCPTPLYKKFFQFYNDSFAVLSIGDLIVQSYLMAYEQQSEKQNGFTSMMYDILYGIPIKNIAEIKKIHAARPYEIGSTGPLTGGEESLGKAVAQGIDAAIYNFNLKGGNSNTYVRDSVLDDQLVPRFAQKNIDLFKTYAEIPGATGGDIILAPVGTETLSAYFDKVKNNSIAVLFPYTGNKNFRDPALKSIIHFIPSHTQEIHALIDYMIAEYNVSNFAFFYQNDEYGNDALEAAHTELEKRGIKTWTDISYSQNQTNFSNQVAQLKKASPDVIGFFSISAPAQEFINQTGANFFAGRHLFGISFAESLDIDIFLKKLGIPITFSYLTPNPNATDLPILTEYHAAMDKFRLPYEDNSLIGFIAGELFLDAFRHLKPPFTKEAIIAYFEGLKNYNFKGLNLTFNPETRSLGQPVWINTERNEWIKYDV